MGSKRKRGEEDPEQRERECRPAIARREPRRHSQRGESAAAGRRRLGGRLRLRQGAEKGEPYELASSAPRPPPPPLPDPPAPPFPPAPRRRPPTPTLALP